MKEKWEGTVGVALITFLLVMACIGWAKYVDEKDKAELWYERYSDEVDELRDVKDSRDYLDRTLNEVIHDRDFCQTALDDVPAYCSEGMYQEKIDGLIAEINHWKAEFFASGKWCEGQVQDAVMNCDFD